MFDKGHQQRKEVIINFLKQHGYPKMEPERVIHFLMPIWKELDKHSLIPPGMTYEVFSAIAVEKYFETLIRNEK